jgi:hypothetical protein
MIRHVVVLTWLPEATQEQRQHVLDELATLSPLMRGLLSYSFGPDAGLVAGNADLAIVADFDDADAYLAYKDHPVHLDVMKNAVSPILQARSAVQFQV